MRSSFVCLASAPIRFAFAAASLTIALLVSVDVAADGQADRKAMAAAWQNIMSDLETTIRASTSDGPLLGEYSLEDYGWEQEEWVNNLKSNATTSELKAEYELLQRNMEFRRSSVYSEDFTRTIPEKEFQRKMWKQFETSFNREIRKLSPGASGLLMAHFSTSYQLRPPAFATRLVWHAWAGEEGANQKILKHAQMLIWRTGNATAIREMVPQFMTNRMSSYSLFNSENHKSNKFENWLERYPKQMQDAFTHLDYEIERGALKPSALYNGAVGEHALTGLPHREVAGAFKLRMQDLCKKGFSEIGKGTKTSPK